MSEITPTHAVPARPRAPTGVRQRPPSAIHPMSAPSSTRPSASLAVRRRTNRNRNSRSVASRSVGHVSIAHALRNTVLGPPRTTTQIMTIEYTALSTSGSGTLAPIFKFDPSGFSRWTNISAEYDEYRVLGARIKYFSVNPTGLDGGIYVTVYDDDDDTSALTSYAQALDYPVRKQMNVVWTNSAIPSLIADRWQFADAGTGIPWTTCATPSATKCSFKGYGTNLTFSAAYFCVSMEIVCQFRGTL